MKSSQLVDLFQRARGDNSLAVIEGVQALKHAVRFKAEISHYVTCDSGTIDELLEELAPDVKEKILTSVVGVNEETFSKLNARPHRTKVIALAKRAAYSLGDIVKDRPIVFLEDPKDPENVGAVIRVSAAANAAAVVITGDIDIWHPAVIRGAAGLQWALPVLDSRHPEYSSGSTTGPREILQRVQKNRKVIALDPTGQEIASGGIPENAVLVFGTERHGISQELLDKSDQIIRLPMRGGVSSLNLATSVAATLYRL